MRSYLLLLVFGFYLSTGLIAPFAVGLGYVWVDLYSPQRIGWSIINTLPVALIMAGMTVGSYLLADRRAPPKPNLAIALLLVWAVWVTLTTTWALLPGPAWIKWDWAIKTIGFAAFLPFLFRTRIQVEALLLTVALAVGANTITFGAKTLAGGGGYGMNLGLLSGNSGLAEGSTLAATACAMIPILIYMLKHGRILPEWWGRLFLAGLIFASVLTIIGTHARAGLVCLAVLSGLYLLASRHKLAFAAAISGLVVLVVMVAPAHYFQRMSTITSYGSESSALGRIAVWLWTIDFAASHPLGGGFEVYQTNSFQVPIEGSPGEFLEIRGKAFHNIFFEVLGEQGYVGLLIYLGLLGTMFLTLWRVARHARKFPDLDWMADLARSLQIAALVYMAGGQFVAIAFQPMLYYFLALSVALNQYLARVTAPEAPLRRRSAVRPGALSGTALQSGSAR